MIDIEKSHTYVSSCSEADYHEIMQTLNDLLSNNAESFSSSDNDDKDGAKKADYLYLPELKEFKQREAKPREPNGAKVKTVINSLHAYW
jgi:hypothetical protein